MKQYTIHGNRFANPIFLLLLVPLLCLGGSSGFHSLENYELKELEGWRVHVNKKLLTAEGDLGKRAMELLRVKLYDINRTVPGKALERLHEVPVWMELEMENSPGACYHPSEKWLKEHGYNPKKARSIEISNARNFLAWTLDQPSMVLHELAHAYHHRVLGYDHPDVGKAFKRAKKSGSYESVLRYNGAKVRAYAMNNDQEYFAEPTEAYFGVNDFYPFVRAEVKEHDPMMCEVLEKLWKGE